MATGLPFAKTLITYNNSLEENEDKEKKSIYIDSTELKVYHEIMKILLTLNDRVYKKKIRKILLILTSLKITNANWWEIFSKK